MHQCTHPCSMPDRGKAVKAASRSRRECLPRSLSFLSGKKKKRKTPMCNISWFFPGGAFAFASAFVRSIVHSPLLLSFPRRLLAGIIGEGIKAAKLRVVEDKGRKSERARARAADSGMGRAEAAKRARGRRLTNRISFRLPVQQSIHPPWKHTYMTSTVGGERKVPQRKMK